MTQHAKHTVKAKVLITNAIVACLASGSVGAALVRIGAPFFLLGLSDSQGVDVLFWSCEHALGDR
jgi:hypothetical protein